MAVKHCTVYFLNCHLCNAHQREKTVLEYTLLSVIKCIYKNNERFYIFEKSLFRKNRIVFYNDKKKQKYAEYYRASGTLWEFSNFNQLGADLFRIFCVGVCSLPDQCVQYYSHMIFE